MNVVVAAHAWYGDVIGGSFRLASEFAEYLAGEGHRVSYVCCGPSRGGRLVERETCQGVHVWRYAALERRVTGLGRLRYHVAQTAKIIRKIRQEAAVDAISGHSPLQFLGAARAAGGHAIFKNYTVHSPFDDELRSNGSGGRESLGRRLAARMAHWVDGKNVGAADRVQTDSQYTLDVMTRKHGDAVRRKGIVAPGWVDTGRLQPVADRHRLRQELGGSWATDVPVFFTLRRLEARMGLDTLIEASGRLRNDGHSFRVLIGGSGALQEELQRQIEEAGLEERVILLGRLPEADLPGCYAAADCFVLPTRALECFGLIVLESFASGTPVIASRTAAIPELAARQGEGWMFEPGNAEQLAERMKSFLQGTLKTELDFREMVEAYDRPVVLQQWAKLLERD